MKKKLFAFDMDGTLLSNSDQTIISEETKAIVAYLRKQGHIVCLFTGRPWRASKKIYDELKLDTIIVNYNGGYIHHPKNYDFIPVLYTVETSSAMKVLEYHRTKDIANNIVVEGAEFIQLQKKEDSFFVNNFIRVNDKQILNTPISYDKMLSNPVGILIEIKKKYAENIHMVSRYFKSRFGDLGAFYYWKTGQNNNPILEFTSYKAKKSMALIKVARYYNIDMNDTLAFGDGYNDIDMLKMAGIGVAMSNANDLVKSYANVVSKYSNKENGIAKFIKWYLKTGYKQVDQTIYKLDRPSFVPKQEINV